MMLEHEQLTEKIIGCAYTVHNKMGFGFLESVYEKCLIIEMRKAGLNAENQRPITVYYENEVVGEFLADLVVENAVIIELKSLQRVIRAHEVQLVNYLTATRIEVGLLLNFSPKSVEVRRKVRILDAETDF